MNHNFENDKCNCEDGKCVDCKCTRTRGFETVDTKFLKSYKETDEVKMPLRGTATSAGYDFFMSSDAVIEPNSGFLVWTDVKAYMLDDEVLELYPRSSIGVKRNIRIKNTVGIIDSDYYSNEGNDGNIGLFLWNFGTEPQTFKKGDAVVQAIFKEFLASDNCNSEVERVGGVGSTTEGGK